MGARLARHVATARARAVPVQRPSTPDALAEALSARLAGGADLDALMAVVELVLERSVVVPHPRFFNQNFAGPDPVAIAGDWLTAVLNTNMATYEMAPVLTVMELEVLRRMAVAAGFRTEGDDVPAHVRPGVFLPGGSMGNMHALLLARHRVVPEADAEGLHAAGGPLAVFTSAQSHYSIAKSAMALGLGRAAVRKVSCDARGRMLPEALRDAMAQARNEGARPCMVNATAGTTVAGAFDPLDAIADVCEAEDVHMHVDGCFGGSALMSGRRRELLAGVARADSLTWNPHKMLGMTQQCSVLLVRRPEQLREVVAGGADYLFQGDKPHAELDGGDLALSCARRADALKLWLSWQVRGDAGFEARIDHAADLAADLAATIDNDERFALAVPANAFNVCFWWVPPSLRPLNVAPRLDAVASGAEAADAAELLHRLTPRIKLALAERGDVMVGYAPLGDIPHFFRMLFMNPDVTRDDVKVLLDRIDEAGRGLTSQ